MSFFTRNARFIVPLPLLLLAVMKAWEASQGQAGAGYGMATVFFSLAVVFFVTQQQLHTRRQQDAKQAAKA